MFRYVTTLVIVSVLAGPTSSGFAQTNTQKELAALAESVARVLDGQGAKEIQLGMFVCPNDPHVNHAPQIILTLQSAFKKHDVTVKMNAKFRLEGEYAGKRDPRSRRVFIELTAKVVRVTDDRVIVRYPRGIFGVDALVSFLAPSGLSVDPGAPEKTRESSVVEQLENPPTVPIKDDTVYASQKQDYGMEVLVKHQGGFDGRKPHQQKDNVYVPLKRGEEFVIRLVNNTNFEAAVDLTLDGVNAFAFSPYVRSDRGLPRWLVPAKGEAYVVGWLREEGVVNAFEVVGLPQGAAAMLNIGKAKVGVISAQFRAAWPSDEKPPIDEPEGGKGEDAIGLGKPIRAETKTVERTFGSLRAVVSIRYDK